MSRRLKTNKRNLLLSGHIESTEDAAGQPEIKKDEFLPKYELEYALPDVPVKPKLFRHINNDPMSVENNLYKYEYNTVEMIQEQSGQTLQIYTDYNIGMKTNLADREMYKLPQDSKFTAAELKAKMNEKLKFVLSDKDEYDPYEGQKKAKQSKVIVIPTSYTAQDKVHHYGGKIADPFELHIKDQDQVNKRVFTSKEHQKSEEKKKKGIQQIKDTFEKVKEIKEGMVKPGTTKVTAAKVFNILPQFQALPLKVLHVINNDDTALEENLPIYDEDGVGYQNSQIIKRDEAEKKAQQLKKKYHSNNGQILMEISLNDDDQRCALYRFDHQEDVTDQLAEVALGKRPNSQQLNNAVQLEHVRNYAFSRHTNDAKDEYIVQIDNNKNLMTYLPIHIKLALQKKRMISNAMDRGSQDDFQNQNEQDYPRYLQLAPRSHTNNELKKIRKVYEENETQLQAAGGAAHFEGNKELHQLKQDKIGFMVNKLFEPRVSLCEQYEKAAIKAEIDGLRNGAKRAAKDEDNSDQVFNGALDQSIEYNEADAFGEDEDLSGPKESKSKDKHKSGKKRLMRKASDDDEEEAPQKKEKADSNPPADQEEDEIDALF